MTRKRFYLTYAWQLWLDWFYVGLLLIAALLYK